MATKEEELLTKTGYSKEIMEQNAETFQIMDFYKKTIDLIERTKIVMGKKTTYTVTSSSTIHQKLKSNVVSSTH